MHDASDRRRVEHEIRCIRVSAQEYLQDLTDYPHVARSQASGNYQAIIERCDEALRAMGGNNG